MGRQTGSIRAHRVAAALETRATDTPPDYIVAFEVPSETQLRPSVTFSRRVPSEK